MINLDSRLHVFNVYSKILTQKILLRTTLFYLANTLLFQKQLLLLPSENLTSGVQQVEESHPMVLT